MVSPHGYLALDIVTAYPEGIIHRDVILQKLEYALAHFYMDTDIY